MDNALVQGRLNADLHRSSTRGVDSPTENDPTLVPDTKATVSNNGIISL